MDIFNTFRSKILKTKPIELADDKTGNPEFPLFIDGFGQYGKWLKGIDDFDEQGRRIIKSKIALSKEMLNFYTGFLKPESIRKDEHGFRWIYRSFLATNLINLNPNPTNPTLFCLESLNHRPSVLVDKLYWFGVIREQSEQIRNQEEKMAILQLKLNRAKVDIYAEIDNYVEVIKRARQAAGRADEDVSINQQPQGELNG